LSAAQDSNDIDASSDGLSSVMAVSQDPDTEALASVEIVQTPSMAEAPMSAEAAVMDATETPERKEGKDMTETDRMAATTSSGWSNGSRSSRFALPPGWKRVSHCNVEIDQSDVDGGRATSPKMPATTHHDVPAALASEDTQLDRERASEEPESPAEPIYITCPAAEPESQLQKYMAQRASVANQSELDQCVPSKKLRLSQLEKLYEFTRGESRQLHSLTLAMSLASLRQHIIYVWGGVMEAATAIAEHSELNEPDMMTLSATVEMLQASGYPCDCGEVCALFTALDIDLTGEEGSMSTAEFMRLAELEQHCKNDDDSDLVKVAITSLRIHQTHRVLVQSLSTPEQLLAEMHVALFRMTKQPTAATALSKWLGNNDAATSEGWPSLAYILDRCLEGLSGPEYDEFARAIVCKRGLFMLTGIMLKSHVPTDLRALAASVISLAVEKRGGPDFQMRLASQTMMASFSDWLDSARARAWANITSKNHLWHEAARSDRHKACEPLTTLSDAPRLRIPTPPTTVDDRRPSELELTLANYLWRPMLESIDPEDTQPEPLTPHIYAQMLALLRQTHLPVVIVGPCGARLMQHVSSALRRLQGSGRRHGDARKVVMALDEFCHIVSPIVVHQLAAALGGRRLLRDRMAMLGTNTDAELLQRCQEIFSEWCYERRRLGLRWSCPARKWQDDAKFNAILKTANVTGAEGLAPAPAPPDPSMRPGLLTAPAPPKTAALRPSPLLQLQGWNSGNEDTLVSWLDDQSTGDVQVPHAYQRSPRKTPRHQKLPPVSARQRRLM